MVLLPEIHDPSCKRKNHPVFSSFIIELSVLLSILAHFAAHQLAGRLIVLVILSHTTERVIFLVAIETDLRVLL